MQNEFIIRVQTEWDGWRHGHVRVSDLRDIHWRQPDRAPHPLLHGYITCQELGAANVDHACDAASAPHRLLVCVLKKHTVPTVYAQLAERAGVIAPEVHEHASRPDLLFSA